MCISVVLCGTFLWATCRVLAAVGCLQTGFGKSDGLLLLTHKYSPQEFSSSRSKKTQVNTQCQITGNLEIPRYSIALGGGMHSIIMLRLKLIILGGRWWYFYWTGGGGAECSQGASETVRQQHHSVERTATGVAGFRPRLGTDATRTTSESHVTYIPPVNPLHGAL